MDLKLFNFVVKKNVIALFFNTLNYDFQAGARHALPLHCVSLWLKKKLVIRNF